MKKKRSRSRSMTFEDDMARMKEKLHCTEEKLQEMKELCLAQALEIMAARRARRRGRDDEDDEDDEEEEVSEKLDEDMEESLELTEDSEDSTKKKKRKKRQNPTRYHAWPLWLRLVQDTGCTRKKGFMSIVQAKYDKDLAEVVHEKVMNEILKTLLKKNRITGSLCPVEALRKMGVEFLAATMGFDEESPPMGIEDLLKKLVQHKALIKAHVEEFENWDDMRKRVYQIDGVQAALEEVAQLVNASD